MWSLSANVLAQTSMKVPQPNKNRLGELSDVFRKERIQQRGRLELAFVLEHFGPITNQPSKASLRSAFASDDKVVHALLHRDQKVRVGRLCPEVLSRSPCYQGTSVRRAGLLRSQGLRQRPKCRLHRPDPTNAAELQAVRTTGCTPMLRPAFQNRKQPKYLAAKLCELARWTCRVREIAGIAATNIFVSFNTRPDKRKVHLHRNLTGRIGIDVFAHIPVGRTGRCATFIKLLV